ncbi:hypothetical protein E3N88_16534 [Mikania micrantha]|uniref:Uncharacterized protein n=1 Tax=Mikania micrantha TaxID=192012 RepID=A0A5N6NYN8_9ASTR|nr:hypothetical protein E3N88_16534 [Mikania micrantha]
MQGLKKSQQVKLANMADEQTNVKMGTNLQSGNQHGRAICLGFEDLYSTFMQKLMGQKETHTNKKELPPTNTYTSAIMWPKLCKVRVPRTKKGKAQRDLHSPVLSFFTSSACSEFLLVVWCDSVFFIFSTARVDAYEEVRVSRIDGTYLDNNQLKDFYVLLKAIRVTLSIKYSGYGFVSQELYLHEFFNVSIKLPAYTTATLTNHGRICNGSMMEGTTSHA